MANQYVYTIWKKVGSQKPKIVDSFLMKSTADKKFKRITKDISKGYKFRMEKNKINSIKHGKIIRKKN